MPISSFCIASQLKGRGGEIEEEDDDDDDDEYLKRWPYCAECGNVAASSVRTS